MDLPATQDQGPPPAPLSSQQRLWVHRAISNLYTPDVLNPRLEPLLKSQGIDREAIVGRKGRLFFRRIFIEDGSGLFEIDAELGESAFVMAVHGVEPGSEIDLVAWPIMRPESFATYFGYAGLLGGDAALNPASFVVDPCPIWATPLAWLQADLRGCVVLDPRLAAPILRKAPGQFQAEDVDQAQWLVDTGAVPVSELLVPVRRASA